MPLFDRKDKSRYATFSRRSLLAAGGMTGVFAVLAGRLYQLQILDYDEFMTQAEDNRINERLITPARGRIIDRFGVELANDRRNYRVLLVPEQAADGAKTAVDAVARLLPIGEHQREKILHEVSESRPFAPVVIAENLSWDDFARINLHLPYLSGIIPDVGETRAYPFGEEFAHVLGYVAAVSPEDKKNDNDPLLSLPGFRIGKRGIEKTFDEQIRGAPGISRVEVNAHGRVIRELSREAARPGQDIYLTIDRELQHFVSERLGGESAACVVMDTETGDVLALESSPGFDPNLFNVGISTAQWHALVTNDHSPLMNKALTGAYPPGSTFKTVVAAAAVDAGVAVPGYTVFCSGSVTLGNHDFHCWKRGGHGTLDLRGAIQHSCDVFFYETARRIGIDSIEQAAHALGLGAKTGIELPGERSGSIPGRQWKLRRYGVPWQQGETLVTAIGQGYVLATPLQLCTMTARFASGKSVSPRLVHSIGAQRRPVPAAAPLPFTAGALAAVRAGMDATANEPGGTAYAWRITEPGFEMAGKTGTAQVRVITREERAHGVVKNENLPWKLRDHALYVAFAPVGNPRYACAIIVEHGAVAAHPQVQITRDILLFAQKRDIAHRPTAYPSASAQNAPIAKG
jgi:penicillin-binding protein 2